MGRYNLPILALALIVILVAGVLVEARSPAGAQTGPPGVPQTSATKPAITPGAFKKPKHDAPLREGEIARGTRNIAAAWFSDPTSRYRHTPFGSEHHATTLTVSTTEHRVLRLQLPKDSVFEDRMPRLIDLDGDGRDEVVVVRSYERRGAALAILAVRGAELTIIAETPALGTPFQWLNPAGFADFDGDGTLDIALVATPHREGELQFWTLRGGKLEQIAATDDVSNHVLGSRHLRLSVVVDFNGDGVADIALPSQDRRRLRFLTLAGGKLVELGEAQLPGPAAEDFEVVTVGGKPAVRVGLAGGRTVTIAPCRDIRDWEESGGGC